MNLTLQGKDFELDLACTMPAADSDFDSLRVRAAVSVHLHAPEGDTPADSTVCMAP